MSGVTVPVAPRLPCARTPMQDNACRELPSALLYEDCERSCAPQQLCAEPLPGRGGKHSTSERLVPMLLQEMNMSEVEAPGDLVLVGGDQLYRDCPEPGRCHSLLCEEHK